MYEVMDPYMSVAACSLREYSRFIASHRGRMRRIKILLILKQPYVDVKSKRPCLRRQGNRISLAHRYATQNVS